MEEWKEQQIECGSFKGYVKFRDVPFPYVIYKVVEEASGKMFAGIHNDIDEAMAILKEDIENYYMEKEE